MNSRRWEVESNQRGSEGGHGLSPLTPGVVTKSQQPVLCAPGVALTSRNYRGVRRLRGILKSALGSTLCRYFNSRNPLSLTLGARGGARSQKAGLELNRLDAAIPAAMLAGLHEG